MVSVSDRIEMVRYAQSRNVSQRNACKLCNVSRSMLGYIHRQPLKDAKLLEPMKKIASKHPAWGYRLVAAWLHNNGTEASFNRVRRLWKNYGYSALWKKKRKKIKTGERLNPRPIKPNTVWCMDFAEDRLENGNRFLAFVVKDEASALCLVIAVEPSFKGEDVKRILDWLVSKYGCPEFLRCDNGCQFIAFVFNEWAKEKGIQVAHIPPRKPWKNGSAESINSTLRREVLNAELFYTLAEAQVICEEWRKMYNEERPHSRIGYLPPATAYYGIVSEECVA